MTIPKDIKILPSSQVATKDLKKQIEMVMEALGSPSSLVTDKSLVSDFLATWYPDRVRRGAFFKAEEWERQLYDPLIVKENEDMLRRASEKLGLLVEPSDLIITVAHKLKNLARS